MKDTTKKIFSMLLAVIMLVAAIPYSASALTTNDGFTYTINNEEATITGYNGTDKDLYIPNKINGYTVTRIGLIAFSNNTNIKNVYIPETVKAIEQNAFSESSIESVVIKPKTTTTIDSYAFGTCENLKKVILGEGVEFLSGDVFMKCTSLTKIELPASAKHISYCIFENCSNLSIVILKEGVETIGTAAFNFCPIRKIYIPKSTISIDGNALYFESSEHSDVYYAGSPEEWNEIISEASSPVINDNTTVHFFADSSVITDEYTDDKEELDESNNGKSDCSCNCHKTGISGFFWKILRFFYKLFGTNKICGCGVSHY